MSRKVYATIKCPVRNHEGTKKDGLTIVNWNQAEETLQLYIIESHHATDFKVSLNKTDAISLSRAVLEGVKENYN